MRRRSTTICAVAAPGFLPKPLPRATTSRVRISPLPAPGIRRMSLDRQVLIDRHACRSAVGEKPGPELRDLVQPLNRQRPALGCPAAPDAKDMHLGAMHLGHELIVGHPLQK